MTIFHVAFFAVLAWCFFLKYFKLKNWKKHLCIFSGVVYFLIAAIRSRIVGGDTWFYVRMFDACVDVPLAQALRIEEKDPFFSAFLWLVGKITNNYTVLFAFVAIIFCFSVWRFIYKNSKDPMLSIIILFALNFYQFSLTGMRQTLAMAFILIAFSYFQKEKPWKAVAFIVIASLFHLSALICLLLVLLRKIPLNRVGLWLSVVALGLVFIFRSAIATLLIVFLSDRGYDVLNDNAGTTMTLVVFALYVICVVFSRKYLEKDKDCNLFFWAFMVAVFFQMLVPVQAIFFRIAFYFLIVSITLLPNVISHIEGSASKNLVNLGIYAVLTIQYLFFTIGSSHILPYTTFWQV